MRKRKHTKILKQLKIFAIFLSKIFSAAHPLLHLSDIKKSEKEINIYVHDLAVININILLIGHYITLILNSFIVKIKKTMYLDLVMYFKSNKSKLQ